ncbi:hypothetical protein SB773_30870, partial [Bacillus sp. SIMBA_074]
QAINQYEHFSPKSLILLREVDTVSQDRTMPQIVFLGAGSVVFTRQLLADLYRFDDLPSVKIVLHDIDAERLEVARGTAEQVASRFGRTTEIVATPDRRAA